MQKQIITIEQATAAVTKTRSGKKFRIIPGADIHDIWIWSERKLRARFDARRVSDVESFRAWVENGCKGNCFPDR